MPRRLAILISCLFAVSVSPVAAQQGDKDSPARLLFETDVQPLLAKRCGKCHSAKVQKGSLDLSTMGSLRRGGESEEDLVGASIEESLLWSMVEGGDMPPDDEPPLTDRERSLLRRWISTGAAAKEPLKTERSINQHDVFPILLLRCNTCHGPRMKRGNLDLRTRAAMLRGGASGPALKPGDPDNSLMIQRVESSACPPRDSLLKYFVKRPPPSEVKVLRAWIAAGAAEEEISPDIASQQLDPLVSAEDRRHWAFRSPQTSGRHDSIDGFILAKLRERSLGFSPEADRDTLIRRAHLDLIGMPPTIAEWKRWRSRGDSQWYGEMIDHLLESPHYGERWGRYWLDLAGYADSEGGVSADPLRKVAWKYRDYVIRAFNSDKPYDRFLIEQLAGDELIDHENAEEVTSEMVDNLVATGFLRMGIDQTGSRTMNFVSERLGVISDAITVMGEGLMGLTMSCARCHSHKYDPIPQRDYYRFKAVFQGAFDEHDWLTFKNRLLRVDIAERRRRVAKVNPPLLAQSKKLAAQLKKATTDVRLELLKSHYPEQSGAEREATIRALRVADNNRSQPQRILVEMLQQ
ncbi:MAG: DUF1549 domain-containing protein, partial [Pirellulaceae bacterium]|nr:DUF1549 domain-containing protein [Pirellulaceae bacterium]